MQVTPDSKNYLIRFSLSDGVLCLGISVSSVQEINVGCFPPIRDEAFDNIVMHPIVSYLANCSFLDSPYLSAWFRDRSNFRASI